MFTVQHIAARKVAGFHWTGPWEETVAQGFEQLAVWTQDHHLNGEWLAVYYDDPDVVPAEQLRCDTVISVPDDFILPVGSKNASVMTLAEGLYAIGLATIKDNAFSDAWEALFDQIEADGRYQLTGKPCYEHYLNDGSLSGVWELEMFIPIQLVQE